MQFDSMTGQPINQQPQQQPMENQSTTNMYSQPQQLVQQSMNTYQQSVQSQQPKKKVNTKMLIIIAVYNADITSSNTYTIKVKGSDFAENSEFVTTFNNYNIEIEMDITIAGVNTNTVSKGVMDEQHQKEYLDITTTSMGIVSLNNKMYHDFNTGYSYMTQPYGGDVWWKEKSPSQIVDLGVILDKLISMKNVTKIADNHYKVKMTQEDVGGLMASGNANTSAINGDIYVEVYTENGYITRLEYDFTNTIKGFEKFTTTINCSNYDNAGDVEIPQNIIDNAKVQ